jgi:hypothetical protein
LRGTPCTHMFESETEITLTFHSWFSWLEELEKTLFLFGKYRLSSTIRPFFHKAMALWKRQTVCIFYWDTLIDMCLMRPPLIGFCLANWLIHNYFWSSIDGLPIKIYKLVYALISTPSSLFLLNIVEK